MDPARYRFAVRRGRLLPRPAVPLRERLARAAVAVRTRAGGALIACGTFLRDWEPRLPTRADLRAELRRRTAGAAVRLAVPEFCIGLAFGGLLGFVVGLLAKSALIRQAHDRADPPAPAAKKPSVSTGVSRSRSPARYGRPPRQKF